MLSIVRGKASSRASPDLLQLLVFGFHTGEHHAEHLLQARLSGILVDRVVGAQVHLKKRPHHSTATRQTEAARKRENKKTWTLKKVVAQRKPTDGETRQHTTIKASY